MDQAIIDKVIKLLALADDANAAPGEVENARKMAAKLMAKHQIEAIDQAKAAKSRNLFIRLAVETGRQRYIKEDTLLLNVVCHFSQVQLLTGRDTPRYTFIGRDQDVEGALYLYDILTQQRDFKCPKGLSAKDRTAWKNGFAFGVDTQLQELTAKAQETVTERGLVPVNLRDQALQWYNENVQKTSKGRQTRYESDQDGFEAGKNAQINKGIGTQNTETLSLSA